MLRRIKNNLRDVVNKKQSFLRDPFYFINYSFNKIFSHSIISSFNHFKGHSIIPSFNHCKGHSVLQSFSYSIIVLLLLCASAPPVGHNDCKEMVLQYLKKQDEIGNAPGRKAYFMQMKTLAVGNKKLNIPSVEDEIKILISGETVAYESKNVSMYKDNKETYTVVPFDKVIFKENTYKGKGADMYSQRMNMVKDTLVRISSLQYCKDTELAGQKAKEIALVPPAGVRKKYKLEKLIYFMNIKDGRLLKQVLLYSQDSKIIRQEYIMLKEDFDYKNSAQKAKEFLYAGGKLKPQFKGYSVETD